MSIPLSQPRSEAELAEAARTAAAFIRDLHYNAPLRTAYFEALNHPHEWLVKVAVDEIMTRSGYKCFSDDLVAGWDTMVNDPKNLFIYQGLYELKPTTTDGIIHRVTLVAPQDSHATIFFDGDPAAGIVPAAEPYKLQFNVYISAVKFFVKLQLGFNTEVKSKKLANTGVRTMEAKIWKDGMLEPAESTHKGRDWMDDITKYHGKYKTTFGPLHDGTSIPSLGLNVDMQKDSPTATTADVALSLCDELSNTNVPLANGLKPNQNTFSWDSSWRNENIKALERLPDQKLWKHGYLNCTFQYTKVDGGNTLLTRVLKGQVWHQKVSDAKPVTCIAVPEETPGDVDYTTAWWWGLGTTVFLFIGVGFSIFLSIRWLPIDFVMPIIPKIPFPFLFSIPSGGDGCRPIECGAFTEMAPSESMSINSMTNENLSITNGDPKAYTIQFDHGLQKDDLAAKFIDMHDPKTFEVARDEGGAVMKNARGEQLLRNPLDSESLIAEVTEGVSKPRYAIETNGSRPSGTLDLIDVPAELRSPEMPSQGPLEFCLGGGYVVYNWSMGRLLLADSMCKLLG